mgnify:CR=1 FL=1
MSGYQPGMLEIAPNLESLSEEDLDYIKAKYYIIYKTLHNATIHNKRVRLKMNGTKRLPVWNLSYWWSAENEIFQPSDAQINRIKERIRFLFTSRKSVVQ